MEASKFVAVNEFLKQNNYDKEIGDRSVKEWEGMRNSPCMSGRMVFDKHLKERKWVNKMIKKLNKCFNDTPREMKYIDTDLSEGYSCLCHGNSNKASLFLGKDYKRVKGYNIAHSPDGKMVTAEIHSVVKHIPTGELYDFTRDFDSKVKGKWFLECDMITIHHQTNFKLEWGKTRIVDNIANKTEHYCVENSTTYECPPGHIMINDLEQYLDEDLDLYNKMEKYSADEITCISVSKEQKEIIDKLEIDTSGYNIHIERKGNELVYDRDSGTARPKATYDGDYTSYTFDYDDVGGEKGVDDLMELAEQNGWKVIVCG